MGLRLMGELECDRCPTVITVEIELSLRVETDESEHVTHTIEATPKLPPNWDESTAFYGKTYTCPTCNGLQPAKPVIIEHDR